jgi:integrase/recombinase XerD
MTVTFLGPFKEQISSLILEKRRMGFSYLTEEKILLRFDRFCLQMYPTATCFSRDIVMQWAKQKETEGINSRNNRVKAIYQLAKHMQSLGLEAYLIPQQGKNSYALPHIFTNEELNAFFHVADRLPYRSASPFRHLVVPVMFRLMYSCGLRLSEACYLKRKEFDLPKGEIRVLQSKGRKDRLVYLSDDVSALCLRLDQFLHQFLPQREWFFVIRCDRAYEKTSICRLFNTIWQETMFYGKTPIKPSTHSFRHTFAVHCLKRWMMDEEPIENRLKYLSLYMGHTSLSYTQHYIHFVDELFSLFKDKLKDFDRLLPEVSHE